MKIICSVFVAVIYGLCAGMLYADDGVIYISDYDTGPGDVLANAGPSADATPAFTAALLAAKTNGYKEIRFNAGTYHFETAPPKIDFSIRITGYGKWRTTLVRDYSPMGANPLGFLTFVAGASVVSDLGIVASATSSGGNAIRLIGDDTSSPDFSVFQNLYLSTEGTSTNKWDSTVYIDGTARINAPNGPRGVRDIDFTNCNIFGASNAALVLDDAIAFSLQGGGLFRAGGNSGKISIAPSNGYGSWYVNIDTTNVDGMLMQKSIYGNFRGTFSAPITTSSSSRNNLVIGHVEGGVQSFWVDSKHISPE